MQILNFLLVRKSQFIRELKALGWFYGLILLAGITAAFIIYTKFQAEGRPVIYSGVFLVFVTVCIHLLRTDQRFLRIAVLKPWKIFASEYLLLLSPFLFISVIKTGNVFPLTFLVAAPFIAFIPVMQKVSGKQTLYTGMIPSINYEWKSGFRRYRWLLIILAVAAVGCSFLPFVSFVLLWFMLLIISSFYEQGESREMVEAHELGGKSFILFKLKQQTGVFLSVATPLLMPVLLFDVTKWWVIIFFLVFGSINIAVFVVSKYAIWQAGELNRSAGILNAVCMIGLFIPFLLPLPVLVFFRNYRKSVKNMEALLHDYHR